METEIASGGYEEGLEQVALRQGVHVPRDVEDPPCHGYCSPEAQDFVQVVGGHLSVVSLVVREVEMVGQSLLSPGESHWLEQGLAAVLKRDDQLQLSSSLLLLHTCQGVMIPSEY